QVGTHILGGIEHLKESHPVISDVRRVGLFLCVELTCRNGAPATDAAAYIVNRLRDHRILIGTDRPRDNVLKIGPHLCCSDQDADSLLNTLENILGEVPIKKLAEDNCAN
ncbi:MAG: hypothetical protein ACR2QU_00780, partial [Gammaproteobacteria bacterium]